MKERSLQNLRLETFSEQLSSHFQVIPVEGTSLPLLLVEVERRAPHPGCRLRAILPDLRGPGGQRASGTHLPL